MTRQRLELLMKRNEIEYVEGSPLLLVAYALYMDRDTDKCVAQLKWRNIDQRPVKAVLVEISGIDVFGQEVGPVQFRYGGLLATQGTDFGGNTPLVLQDDKMVKFNAVLKAVAFADTDQTIWRPDSDGAYKPLPESKPQLLKDGLLEQLKAELAEHGSQEAASFSAQAAFGLWQCGCGSWQYAGSACLQCKMTQEGLSNASEPSMLQRNLAVREEKLRIEAEKRAERARIAREVEEELAFRKRAEIHRIMGEESVKRREVAWDLAAKKKKKRSIMAILLLLLAVGIGYLVKYLLLP